MSAIRNRRANNNDNNAIAKDANVLKEKNVANDENVTTWLCPDNASKRSGEQFFLVWTAIWISIVAVVVATEVFEVTIFKNFCF
jgi:hypothetical protein